MPGSPPSITADAIGRFGHGDTGERGRVAYATASWGMRTGEFVALSATSTATGGRLHNLGVERF